MGQQPTAGQITADLYHDEHCCDEHPLHGCDIVGYTELCWTCSILIARTLATLAANLAIGAALCRAFALGGEFRVWMSDRMDGWYDDDDEPPWSDGCGRSAP